MEDSEFLKCIFSFVNISSQTITFCRVQEAPELFTPNASTTNTAKYKSG